MQLFLSELRLAGSGSSANQGRVEVYANGQWGTICDDFWGQEDANVVCRQLGFPGASGYTKKAETFGAGSGPILLDNVRCVGNETSIMDCPKKAIGVHNCRHSKDAGVICRVAQGKSAESLNRLRLLFLLRKYFSVLGFVIRGGGGGGRTHCSCSTVVTPV